MQTGTGRIAKRWLGMGCRALAAVGMISKAENVMRLDHVFFACATDSWAVLPAEQTRFSTVIARGIYWHLESL